MASDDGVEYRIEYQIQRRDSGADEDDFTELGFGSSGGWTSVNHAAYMVECAVQSREWETEQGQPDPDEVDQ